MAATAAQALLPLVALVLFLTATLFVYAARRRLVGPAHGGAEPAPFLRAWWGWLSSRATWSPVRPRRDRGPAPRADDPSGVVIRLDAWRRDASARAARAR